MFVFRLIVGALCAALLAACSGSGIGGPVPQSTQPSGRSGSSPASTVTATSDGASSDATTTSSEQSDWHGGANGFGVSPASLAFDALGARKTFSAQMREHGHRGTWLAADAASSDTHVCTVDPEHGTGSDGSITFTVTSVSAGSCHIDVRQRSGSWWTRGHARVDVTVSACSSTSTRPDGVTPDWNSTPQPSCSPEPGPSPSAAPSPKPTATPTAKPSAGPSPTASPSRAPSPTATPTALPTATPTLQPSAKPTLAPTATPTGAGLACSDIAGEIQYPISPSGGTFVVPAGAAGTTATIGYPANNAPAGSYACLAAVQNYPTTGNIHYDFHLIDPNLSTYATVVVTFGTGASAILQNPSWVADAGEYVEQIEENCDCVNDTLPGGQSQSYTSAQVTAAGSASEISPFDNGQIYFGSNDAQAALDGSYSFYYQNPIAI